MLFALPAWGFERIHPAGMSVEFVRRVLDTIPNIVAIKSEQGFPLVAGVCEMYHHFRDEVVISCPIEADALPLMGVMDMQFSGTSNTQWMSGWYPETFELARTGRWEEAMERFWAVQPARQANAAATQAYIAGTSVLNRTMWKYQDWLAGYNGGPLRAPAMRVPDRLMRQLRAGLQAAGLPVTDAPDSEYLERAESRVEVVSPSRRCPGSSPRGGRRCPGGSPPCARPACRSPCGRCCSGRPRSARSPAPSRGRSCGSHRS